MSKKKRAKVIRRVTTGAVAASAVGVAAAGIALAARRTEQTVPKLPAPGATIGVDLASKGLELIFAGQKIKTGPLEGRAIFEIEPNKGDPTSVQTKLSEFYLTSPAKQGGVTIAIEATTRKNKDRSVLRRNRSKVPSFEHALRVPLTITVRNPEALGLPADTEESLTLTAEDPAILMGKLSSFPPRGARYKLKDATELSLPGQPGIGVATIVKFPIKVNGF
jgi:hypothetical protein